MPQRSFLLWLQISHLLVLWPKTHSVYRCSRTDFSFLWNSITLILASLFFSLIWIQSNWSGRRAPQCIEYVCTYKTSTKIFRDFWGSWPYFPPKHNCLLQTREKIQYNICKNQYICRFFSALHYNFHIMVQWEETKHIKLRCKFLKQFASIKKTHANSKRIVWILLLVLKYTHARTLYQNQCQHPRAVYYLCSGSS